LLLGLGRALGETIAVFLVVGRRDNQWPDAPLSPRAWLDAGQTLTSKLGSSETFVGYGDPLHWGAIVGLGLVLMVVVGALAAVAGRWLPQGLRRA
jgi:phosphate transport system permease protein